MSIASIVQSACIAAAIQAAQQQTATAANSGSPSPADTHPSDDEGTALEFAWHVEATKSIPITTALQLV